MTKDEILKLIKNATYPLACQTSYECEKIYEALSTVGVLKVDEPPHEEYERHMTELENKLKQPREFWIVTSDEFASKYICDSWEEAVKQQMNLDFKTEIIHLREVTESEPVEYLSQFFSCPFCAYRTHEKDEFADHSQNYHSGKEQPKEQTAEEKILKQLGEKEDAFERYKNRNTPDAERELHMLRAILIEYFESKVGK